MPTREITREHRARVRRVTTQRLIIQEVRGSRSQHDHVENQASATSCKTS